MCVEIGDGGGLLVHIKLNVLVIATIALIVDVELAIFTRVVLTLVENDEVVGILFENAMATHARMLGKGLDLVSIVHIFLIDWFAAY